MFKLEFQINHVQHIQDFSFSLDLTQNKITAIVGKNGVGKTLLFKAMQNLVTANTFATTSNKHIFNENSQIIYTIDDAKEYKFSYEPKIETIDLKDSVGEDIVKNISVELPIPFGTRFEFRRFGEIDSELRRNIISKQFNQPTELIELLNFIYDTDRFENLIEVTIKKKKFYAIVLPDNYYIREDYLSSGEYFIISIYKLIQSRCKLIAIDEIDISLDAMVQVRFLQKIREMIQAYEINLVFTTHSLGLMKTLKSDELFYMEFNNGTCTIENSSYNYIKSLLYGFTDYDKYLLVEDEVLKEFIEFVLAGEAIFNKYIILPIGGADNVIKLMEKNTYKEVFTKAEHVMSVLDGDKSSTRAYKDRPNILFLPFKSVEKDFYKAYKEGAFGSFSQEQLASYNLQSENAKNIYNMFLRENIKSSQEINQFLTSTKSDKVASFKTTIMEFLNG